MANQMIQPSPPPELIIADEAVSVSGVATASLSANVVYLYAFVLRAPTIFSGAKWRMGATTTGTTDIGIYSFAGSLLIHTGAVTNVASTNMSANFSGNATIYLPPGQYFMALCPSNGTDTYNSIGISNPAIQSNMRQGTTAGTAGVLPNSTGGYSDTPARFPGVALTVVGGLT